MESHTNSNLIILLPWPYCHGRFPRDGDPEATPRVPLKGKTGIVTCGMKNIGAGIAYDLSKRGADVCSPSLLDLYTNTSPVI